MKQLVGVQAGWVFIGTRDTAFHDAVRLTKASVLRVWGTKNGLGEIALNGPTKATVLDPCGVVTIPHSALLFTLECKV